MTGQRPHAAIALNCLARSELELGEPEKAYDDFRRVLAEYTSLGFPPVQTAEVLTHLGRCCQRLDRWQQARDHFLMAIEHSRAGGSRHEEAAAFEGLSEVAVQLGEAEEAARYQSRALRLWDALGAPEAARLRTEASVCGADVGMVAARPPPKEPSGPVLS